MRQQKVGMVQAEQIRQMTMGVFSEMMGVPTITFLTEDAFLSSVHYL